MWLLGLDGSRDVLPMTGKRNPMLPDQDARNRFETTAKSFSFGAKSS
jgi:hypothetical protein